MPARSERYGRTKVGRLNKPSRVSRNRAAVHLIFCSDGVVLGFPLIWRFDFQSVISPEYPTAVTASDYVETSRIKPSRCLGN
jgi:hypothetical protein